MLQGDFGVSLANRRPIAELIGTRLVNTLFLALYAAAIAVPLAIALGRAGGALPQLARSTGLVNMSP